MPYTIYYRKVASRKPWKTIKTLSSTDKVAARIKIDNNTVKFHVKQGLELNPLPKLMDEKEEYEYQVVKI